MNTLENFETLSSYDFDFFILKILVFQNLQGYAKESWRQKNDIGSLAKQKFSRLDDFGTKQTNNK